MGFETKLLVCFTILAVNGQYSLRNQNLVAVVQIFRHGHRTPVQFYTNDPYSDKSYWDGLDFGQLTNEGKRQHYALGQFTRKRYGDWLSLKYNKDDFTAFTTDTDRSHMSGQSNLNGLYPAVGDQRWRLFSDWQAIPLHPANSDIFAPMPSANCTNYYIGYANALASDEFKFINEKYADLLAYLSKHSGDNITDVASALILFDCLKIENDVHLKLPLWATPIYPNPLYQIAGYTFEQLTFTKQLLRLLVGPFLNEIVHYFEGLAKNSTTVPKYRMYSGHDSNVAAVLKAFGAFDPAYPPDFASTVYIELRTLSGKYYVNVWSKNGNDFKQVSVKGCALDCPLNEFKERLSDIIIDVETKNEECNPQGITDRSSFFASSKAEKAYSDLLANNGIEKLIARC